MNAPPFILDGSNAAAVAQTMQQLIDDLPEQIALLDEQCTILVTNRGWKEAVDQHGYRELSVGHNYRHSAHRRLQKATSLQSKLWQRSRTLAGELVPIGSSHITEANVGAGAITKSVSTGIAAGTEALVSVARFDLTEIEELRREKAAFGPALIASQTVERQRIARELHDSTSQLLTAAGLLLCRLKQISRGLKSRTLVDELQALIDRRTRDPRCFVPRRPTCTEDGAA